MRYLAKVIRRNVVSYRNIPPPIGVSKNWSDGTAWPNGVVPDASTNTQVPVGKTIRLDVTNPAMGNMEIAGTLVIPNGLESVLETHSIMLLSTGKIIFADGVPGNYTGKFTWLPRGAVTGTTDRFVAARTGQTAIQMGFFNNGIDRSFMIEDGGEILGGPPEIQHHWRLAEHAKIGDNSIRVRYDGTAVPATAIVKQGDKFVISTTDYAGMSDNEEMEVAFDSIGDTITFTTTFKKFHWGPLQYINETSTGVGHLSTYDKGWRPDNDAVHFFDSGAHVMRLNRTIRMDGSADGAPGSRFMIHGRTGTIRMDGWEFAYMGRDRTQQWYGGVHWHMPSYNMPNGHNSPSDGTYAGGSLAASMCKDHLLINSSCHHSANRGHVPHGSNGVTMRRVVGYKITASFVFFEEGSAQYCTLDDWHVITVTPVLTNPLQLFDGLGGGASDGAASAVWHTNPTNTISNGSAGDVYTGVWNAFTLRNYDMPDGFGCFGLSKNIPIVPGAQSMIGWDNNEVYAFRMKAIITGLAQGDEQGQTRDDGYPGIPGPIAKLTNVISRMKFWKGASAYRNRVGITTYDRPSCCDVGGTLFSGAVTTGSQARNGTYILNSLNTTMLPSWMPLSAAPLFTYHGGLLAPGSLVFGYRFDGVSVETEGTNGKYLLTGTGFFKFWSEYLYPVTFWVMQTPGVRLINSDWGFRTPPQHLEQEAPYLPGRALNYDLLGDISGAILMAYPYLGGAANQWWVYDIPFFQFGAANPVHLTLGNGISNGLLTTTRHFGIGDSFAPRYDGITYTRPDPRGFIDWRRLNPADLSEVGLWYSPGGNGSNNVRGVGFQHVAVAKDGVYKLLLNDIPQQYWCSSVYGARANDGEGFVVCIPFTGTKNVGVSSTTNAYDLQANNWYVSTFGVAQGISFRFTEVTTGGSAANIINGAGGRFWQDKANNCVWIRYKGGLRFEVADPSHPDYYPPTDERWPQAQTYFAIAALP